MKVTNQDSDILITYSLGSCVGVTIYDPVSRVGGMIHCMLPFSKIDPKKAERTPAMFVDTGVPVLFKTLYDMGAQKKRLVVKAAGCGNPLGKNEMFKIGERNHTLLKKLLWKNNVMLAAEDVGGTKSRTVRFDVSTGQVIISSGGEESEL